MNMMKINKILLILPLLFAIIGITACDDKYEDTTDDLSWTISPDSQAQVIEKEIKGIIFKFCLLNEQGKPATVFNEGENIIFSLSLKNNLRESISFSTEFINNDFYRVYGNKNTDMGKAWTGTWCEFRYEKMEIELITSETKELNCPWLLSNIFQADYPLCKGNDMNPLPQGEYSTSLCFGFIYTIDGKQKSIKDIMFKINFKVNKK
jgi:hypothetical protein